MPTGAPPAEPTADPSPVSSLTRLGHGPKGRDDTSSSQYRHGVISLGGFRFHAPIVLTGNLRVTLGTLHTRWREYAEVLTI